MLRDSRVKGNNANDSHKEVGRGQDAAMAEVVTTLYGLQVARRPGYNDICLENNALSVVTTTFHNSSLVFLPCS